VVWAGSGIIAMATQERMLRLLDLTGDESYNLSLSVASDIVDKLDCVCVVAFSPLDRYLAIGTVMGVVVMWKFIGAARDATSIASATARSTSSTDWELYFKTDLKSSIRGLTWQRGQGILAATTDEEVVILSESIIHTRMCGSLTVMQDSHSSIVIQTPTTEPWRETSELLIKGMASSRASFVIWSGKQAKVYKVDIQNARAEEFPTFATASQSIAIGDSLVLADEAVFLTDGNTVKIVNFTGVFKGIINFSEGEGLPTHRCL
jgi:intraflagellar transport protein 140